MIIKCYRVYSEFANVWDSIVLDCPSSGQIYDEIDVVLPDGYTYVTNECGENQVIAPNGSACELTLNSIGGQVIIAWTARGGKALRRATIDHTAIPLQEIRAKQGLSQQQLADASGINIRQIQRVELGEAEAGNLTARNLLAIADALGVDPRELI